MVNPTLLNNGQSATPVHVAAKQNQSQVLTEKVFLFFKMAACSEQDVNSKQAHTEICSLDLSSCRGHCDKGNRAFDSDEVSKKALSKGKESDSVDLKKLSDDQFLNLLEEASDFKKCPKEESGFLQQLKKHTSEFGISQNVKICLHDQQSPELICKDKQSCFSSAVEVKSSSTSKNFIHEHFRAEGSVGILGIQKKSKQGTVNIDSMRNAGIGRGKQRIKDLSHSYSFTPTDERSEQSARKIESYKTPFTAKHNWSPVKYTTFRKKENTHESPLTCRKDKIVSSTQDINCKYTGSSSIYTVGNNTHNSQKCIRHSVAESSSGLRNSVCDTKIRGTKCSTNCSFPVTTISQPNGAHSMHQDICTKDVSCTEMDCYKDLGNRKQCDNQEQNDRGCQRRIRPVRINPSHEATSIQLTKCKDLEVKTQVDKKLPLMHRNQVGIKDQETSGTYSGCEGRNSQSCLYPSCANAAEELATSKLSCDSINIGSSYESKKDASQFDVNGNFTSENCTVSQNCSNTILSSNSFISGNSALDDEQSPKSDAVLSKSKQIRNSVEHTVHSENTFGHQGEDINKLVHYILSDDKKNSSFNTGSATVVNSFPKKILTDNKPLLPQEIDKSKASFKEIKNNPHCQRGINVSSYEQIPNKETVHCFDLESSSIRDSVKQNIPLVPDKLGVERILDWSVSSEYETKECVATSSEELEQCANCSNSDFVESEVSSFVRDFYAVTDIAHPLEEEEFRVVKRQRKRHQQKRSDLIKCHVHTLSTERELSSQNQACNSVDAMMLFPALPPAHRSQRGKLDSSRRKSTCSMPPSEHSSADSSDLESVHSLPVGTSVNYPVSTLPHSASVTSSSSAPQASYADVIRMPAPVVGKVLPHQGFSSPIGENSKSTEQRCSQYMDNNAVLEKLQRKDDIIQPSGSSEWIISRLSQLDVNSSGNTLNINGVSPHSTQNGQDFVNPRPIVVSLEKPSFYNSSLQASKNTASSFIHPANFHSPDKKNGENGGLIDCACSLEKAKDKTNEKQISFFSTSVQGSSPLGELSNQLMDSATNERTDSVYSSPHSISSSICDAFKIASSSTSSEQKLNAKTKLPAVIIMDNCLPSENMAGISFGIDFEELIRLSADCVMSAGTVKEASGSAIQEDSACVSTDQNSKEYADSQPMTINSKTEELESSLPSESLSKNVKLDDSGATSLLSVAGKDLCWRDLEVDTRTCNYSHIVGFLSEAWCGVLKDYDKDSPGSGDVKIKYYNEL